MEQLFAQDELRQMIASLRSRHDGARVRVMGAAYWKKGCSSLGRLRLAVLLSVDKGKAERHCLIDVKEAIAPAPRSGSGWTAASRYCHSETDLEINRISP